MPNAELRFRQIHLDFHTSELISDLGKDFDPQKFAETLKQAHVDSVTCFARCHHGMIYYDTKLFPERRHPYLQRNLLLEQVEACHAQGIRVPIYTTVQWDLYTALRHPEWRILLADGRLQGTPPFQPGFYQGLCVNTPYRDFLKEHVRELMEMVPTDGIFFDIVQDRHPCCCKYCLQSMEELGLDPEVEENRLRFYRQMIDRFKREMSELVLSINPEATVFFNAGHIGPAIRSSAESYTHFELESLPSGGWGYLHFPVTARFTRTTGKDFLGMTGKFHTSWGDFHSFKNQAALEFECFRMLALAGKCSVGDQLHPRGELCPVTYDLIGKVYSQVEAKEPWCRGAVPVADIGVFTPEEMIAKRFESTRITPAASGVTRILEEGHHQFDFIDSQSDIEGYKLLIMPEGYRVSPELAEKIKAYLAAGGKLLAAHTGGLATEEDAFAIAELGVEYQGEAPYSPDFFLPGELLGKGLPETHVVMYMRAAKVAPNPGARVLAQVVQPYFERSYRHFCSHRHTPADRPADYPAAVGTKQAIYLAHPVFSLYDKCAPLWCKQIVLNAIDALMPNRTLYTDAPSTALATVNHQEKEKRYIVHLLHYIPERRGRDFDVIENVIPLRNVKVGLYLPVGSGDPAAGAPKVYVTSVPGKEELPAKRQGQYIEFTVPEINGHQMVAVELL